MKKIIEKVKFAALVAADMVLLPLSPCGLPASPRLRRDKSACQGYHACHAEATAQAGE